MCVHGLRWNEKYSTLEKKCYNFLYFIIFESDYFFGISFAGFSKYIIVFVWFF